MSKRSVAEFVNKLFELQTTGHVLLYKGPIAGGGYTEVSVQARRADGYNQLFYDIKQVIAEDGKQAHIQKVNIPSETFVYELIKESIEDEFTRICTREFKEDQSGSTQSEINSSDNDDTSESFIAEQPIKVVRAIYNSNESTGENVKKSTPEPNDSTNRLSPQEHISSNNANKLTSPGVTSAINLLGSEY